MGSKDDITGRCAYDRDAATESDIGISESAFPTSRKDSTSKDHR
jgi:hypothetical protein